MRVKKFVTLVLALFVLSAFATFASAQAPPPRDGRLLVTVVDPSNGVLPGATVTVVGLENATKAVTVPPN